MTQKQRDYSGEYYARIEKTVAGMKAEGSALIRGGCEKRVVISVVADVPTPLPMKYREEVWFHLMGVWDYVHACHWEEMTENQKGGRIQIWHAYTEGLPQSTLNRDLHPFTTPRKGKRRESRQDRHYLEGYLAALKGERVKFLYEVEGQFFRLSFDRSEIVSHLPTWEDLPHEIWSGLGPHGGMYWVYADGRVPAIFFKSEVK